MVALGAVLGALGGVAGLYISWHLEVGAGPAIVLAVAATVGLAALYAATRSGKASSGGYARRAPGC
jgi:ABC-type Mn2+/Zn2+ transport system permease subunit